jgi:hypothetical protein
MVIDCWTGSSLFTVTMVNQVAMKRRAAADMAYVGRTEPVCVQIHIQWVENAVNVAKALGEEDGWDKSPWQALLEELVEMDEKST